MTGVAPKGYGKRWKFLPEKGFFSIPGDGRSVKLSSQRPPCQPVDVVPVPACSPRQSAGGLLPWKWEGTQTFSNVINNISHSPSAKSMLSFAGSTYKLPPPHFCFKKILKNNFKVEFPMLQYFWHLPQFVSSIRFILVTHQSTSSRCSFPRVCETVIIAI